MDFEHRSAPGWPKPLTLRMRLAEKMIAHMVDGGTVRAYRRTDYLERSRVLTERWAKLLTGGSGNVVAFREAK